MRTVDGGTSDGGGCRRAAARRALSFWLPLLVLAGALGGFLYLVATPRPGPDPDPPPPPPAVEVLAVQPETVTLQVHAHGAVRSRTELPLRPEVSGRVVWVADSLVDGGEFRAGEPLLRLEASDHQAELARAELERERADVELAHARRERERLQAMAGERLVSAAELDQAARELRLAAARRREAALSLEQAQLNVARTGIDAPFDGRVREARVETGQFLARGDVAARLYATDYFEVYLPLALEQFADLDIPAETGGMLDPRHAPPVHLFVDIGPATISWAGRLVRLQGELDTRSRLVHGVVRVDATRSDGGVPMLVGMFVRASIRGRTLEGAIRLPRRALREDDTVLVVDADERLWRRPVVVLRRDGDSVLVRDGLATGERVSLTPLAVAVDGMRVRVLHGD